MKSYMVRYALGAFVAASLGAWDCGGDSGGIDAGNTGGPDAPSVTGPYTHFATSGVKIGKNATEATANGFDLTADGKVDNALGKALAGLSAEVDIDGPIGAALTAGEFVILHSLHGDTTNAASATWQVYLGNPFTPPAKPDLTSGSGAFTIATADQGKAILNGTVSSGKFTTTTPGNLTLQLSLLQGSNPIMISLKAARLEATISGNTCTGKIGGGILAKDLNDNLVPALADQINTRIQTDKEASCDKTCGASKMASCCSSTNQTILTLFDTNGDFTITTDEVKTNTFVQAILTADVDILDASGNIGKDGTPESVSIGLGFTCVKGTFTAAGEK
jgi:hypothetical protein